MNYKQLENTGKAKIDILLDLGYSMRKVGRMMSISHSTVSRYKNKVFLEYLYTYYNWRSNSIK